MKLNLSSVMSAALGLALVVLSAGAWAQNIAQPLVLQKPVSEVESRRFVQMDELNTQYLMPIAMGANKLEEGGLTPEMASLYRAQMGYIAAQMTSDPTVPVPDYADCLKQFDGTEASVTTICKLTLDKIMASFAKSKPDNLDFVSYMRLFTLSQSGIISVGRYLQTQFTGEEVFAIASYHAFRLMREKNEMWLKNFRTCLESNSQTLTCKALKLDEVAATLTLDSLKAFNKEPSHDQ